MHHANIDFTHIYVESRTQAAASRVQTTLLWPVPRRPLNQPSSFFHYSDSIAGSKATYDTCGILGKETSVTADPPLQRSGTRWWLAQVGIPWTADTDGTHWKHPIGFVIVHQNPELRAYKTKGHTLQEAQGYSAGSNGGFQHRPRSSLDRPRNAELSCCRLPVRQATALERLQRVQGHANLQEFRDSWDLVCFEHDRC